MKTRHGAIVVDGSGRIVSGGHNRWTVLHGDRRGSIHAERHALSRIPPNTEVEKCSLVVVRVGANGKIGMSYPCGECRAAIEKAGIRRVYYSLPSTANKELQS